MKIYPFFNKNYSLGVTTGVILGISTAWITLSVINNKHPDLLISFILFIIGSTKYINEVIWLNNDIGD